MTHIAEAKPMTTATLTAYAQAGRSWVAVDDSERAVGYAVVDLIDGCAHVEQISVDPDHQGQGLRRALGGGAGLTATALTTFDQVPWSRPL
jgi:ribosomal protein S18 acetylase RimI-like enzyme